MYVEAVSELFSSILLTVMSSCQVAIEPLYEAPYLQGAAYDLFVRTISPSVNARIKVLFSSRSSSLLPIKKYEKLTKRKPSPLSSLVKELDLSHIVHQGAKSTTARLLGRTKSSLEVFVAPQASFAINCWASLSKCSGLRVLDLSL